MKIKIVPTEDFFEPVTLNVAKLLNINVSENGADINYISDDNTEKIFYIPVLIWNDTVIYFE